MLLAQPPVSVIIPTHNRAATLPRTLDALSAQTYPSAKMEVLIVADGCTDNTAEILRNYRAPFILRLLEQDGQGPAAARNHGATQAAGQLLVFFDDDIEVVPGFVEAHVRAHQQRDNSVAVGYLPLTDQRSNGYFERGQRAWWEEKFFKMRQPGYRFGYDDLFSGNFSLSAELFARVGGFDTKLYCHEDYELGIRLLNSDANFVFAVAAVGYHHDNTSLDRALLRRLAEGKADVFLGYRYPELRSRLPMVTGGSTRLSRVLRYLAFEWPQAGDKIATLLRERLSTLEKLWLYIGWRYLFHHLLDYWYWRGVFSELKTPGAVKQFFKGAKSTSITVGPEIDIDLAEGLDAAEQRLDDARAASVRLWFKQQMVARVPGQAGVERLRGAHLRRILATELAGDMLVALAAGSSVNGNGNDCSRPGISLSPPVSMFKETPATAEDYLFLPKKVVELDLSQCLESVSVAGYSGLHALVKHRDCPIGWVTLMNHDGPVVTAEELHHVIRQWYGWSLVPLVLGDPLRQEAVGDVAMPPVSVVVCTRNRVDYLQHCLQRLLSLDYPKYEVIVVDNAPNNEDTAQLVLEQPVRYVREDRPGLDWARNRGITEAKYDIIAFTDDDARPDVGWLRAIARSFAEPEVMAATGPVVPAELETAAQNLFEFGYGGMSHGFYRWFVRRHELTPMKLLWASYFGVGANMAFRRQVFSAIGLFDVALDVGTPSGGGGDVEMFHRLVARGYTLVHEPTALVWHVHRRDEEGLAKLVYNNGRSFGTYLLTCARQSTVNWFTIAHFAARYWLWGWIIRRLIRPRGFPRRLIWRELLGAISSQFAYVATQTHARKIESQFKAIVPVNTDYYPGKTHT